MFFAPSSGVIFPEPDCAKKELEKGLPSAVWSEGGQSTPPLVSLFSFFSRFFFAFVFSRFPSRAILRKPDKESSFLLSRLLSLGGQKMASSCRVVGLLSSFVSLPPMVSSCIGQRCLTCVPLISCAAFVPFLVPLFFLSPAASLPFPLLVAAKNVLRGEPLFLESASLGRERVP